jgi:hypothetical protein
MTLKKTTIVGVVVGTLSIVAAAFAYPPAVGILGDSKSCLSCHVDNGPWSEESKTIIDVIDKETGKSLQQADGSFLIAVERHQAKTLVTVIGRATGDNAPPPYRNAWLYIDPLQIGGESLSKFAPGWSVNLPMACRLVGDKVTGYAGGNVTSLPMTIRPLDDARDADIELQVMLTSGESVKSDAKKGLISNYLVRTVKLRVVESK